MLPSGRPLGRRVDTLTSGQTHYTQSCDQLCSHILVYTIYLFGCPLVWDKNYCICDLKVLIKQASN